MTVTLDLIVRGNGSSRTAREHLAAALPEYPEARVILYGLAEEAGPRVDLTAPTPEALAGAVTAAGDSQVLVYGDESLLPLAQHLQPGLIWITLGSDANGVREIWRVRQQHAWLAGRKVGLLIEQNADGPAPDTDRLMRLSRASRALLVPELQAESEPGQEATPVQAEPEPEVAPVQAEAEAEAEAAPVQAEPEPDFLPVQAEAELEVAPVQTEAKPELDDAVVAEVAVAEEATETPVMVAEPAAEEAEVAPPAETEAEPDAEQLEPPAPEAAPAAAQAPVMADEPAPASPSTLKGEIASMSDQQVVEEKVAAATATAEQALIQRYALVKERRATAPKVAQVEAVMQELLKEMFVLRFAAGPEAAANFEVLSRKLTDASAEYTQLTRTMAGIEAGLAKLAWLKDELEI